MALIHWQPFPEIDRLHRQMDLLFDELTQVWDDPSSLLAGTERP